MARKHYLSATAAGVALAALATVSVWTLPQPAEGTMEAPRPIAAASASLPPIGMPVDESELHLITRPGRYGLGQASGGSRYAVLNGRLVRVSVSDGQLLAVLRHADRILD